MAMGEPYSKTLLFGSVAANDCTSVRRAVGLGANIDGKSDEYDGMSPMHMAALKEDPAMVECLLDLKAQIDIRYMRGANYTPLMLATLHGNPEVMKALLKRGSNINLTADRGASICDIAAGCMKNPEPVWDILLNPENRVDEHILPSHPSGAATILREGINAINTRWQDYSDPNALATAISKGIHWQAEGMHSQQSFIHDLVRIALRKYAVNADTAHTHGYLSAILKNVLDAGVSPFWENASGVYAYDLAMDVPMFLEIFRDKYKPLAERVAQFNPAHDALLDKNNQPTELTKYCCCEGSLGKVLATSHWQNPHELLKMKRALHDALPAPYQESCSADLDTSSNLRNAAGENALRRLTGKPKPYGLG